MTGMAPFDWADPFGLDERIRDIARAYAQDRLAPRIGVVYYHHADERAFFEWLDRMPFVSGYHGVSEDLFIWLSRVPTFDDLWEIIGFCRRYGSQAIW